MSTIEENKATLNALELEAQKEIAGIFEDLRKLAESGYVITPDTIHQAFSGMSQSMTFTMGCLSTKPK